MEDSLTCLDVYWHAKFTMALASIGIYGELVHFTADNGGEEAGGGSGQTLCHKARGVHRGGHIVGCVVGGRPREDNGVARAFAKDHQVDGRAGH